MDHNFTNEFSEEIWSQTYKHYNDKTVEDTWKRVAKDLASVEDDKEKYEKDFFDLIKDFKLVPAGRILANAGSGYKSTTYINCFVFDRKKYDIDSLDGIYEVLRDQAQTLKSEGGWGCNFSFIRPRGAYIHGVGIESPGPVKFMDIFNISSAVVTSGSGVTPKNKKAKKKSRKGAQMAILSCWHPSIYEFITAKRSQGSLDKFNISVGMHDDFMQKVVEIERLKKEGKEIPEDLDSWDLIFPDTTHPEYKEKWNGDIHLWQKEGFPVIVYETVKVSELWETIMQSTYNYNDPGVVFLDAANKTHCWNYGDERDSKILTTNPCGEQALPNASTCLLSSFNLAAYVKHDFSDFDYAKLSQDAYKAVRMLDNVNTISIAPLEGHKESMVKRRRIGLGIMGWGSALMMLKTRFASDKSEKLQKKVMQSICYSAVDATTDLAKEKGMFEGCDKEKHANHIFWDQIELPNDLREKIRKYGVRNSALFSIQPTGNTSILANIVSGGLEPIFMPEYIRTSIVPVCPEHIKDKCPPYWEGKYEETDMFKWTKEGRDNILRGVDEFGVVYKIDSNRGLTVETLCEDFAVKKLKERNEWNPNADWAVTAMQLTPQEHVKDMKGWSKFLDSAASKTLNIPSDYPYQEFKNVYLECFLSGTVKGFTTYRDGTMTNVLASSEKKNEDSSPKINKNNAPKRPKKLVCDIHHPTLNGEKYFCIVGLMEDDPYEIFVGKNEDNFIPKSAERGELVKKASKKYVLFANNKDFNITNGHSDDTAYALTRMISTSLRHGADISFIVEQLQKTEGDLFSFSKVLARTLKKYIEDGKKVGGKTCPSCGSHNLVYQEGCLTCKDCGWSKCG